MNSLFQIHALDTLADEARTMFPEASIRQVWNPDDGREVAIIHTDLSISVIAARLVAKGKTFFIR